MTAGEKMKHFEVMITKYYTNLDGANMKEIIAALTV